MGRFTRQHLIDSRFWRVLLYAFGIVVAYLALTPASMPHVSMGWDKLDHLAAFGAMAWSGALGYRAARQRFVLAVALLLFGGAIELAQLYIPGRDSEWADLVADSGGIVVGLFLAALALYANFRPASRSGPL